MVPWKVLIVDDEEGIHGITRMVFRGYEFEQRPIELISAMSGAQARDLLVQHPDIALTLLDVVMETDSEGLQLVEYIRNELDNQDIRIILRTGHPGYAPEAQVIVNYDINDYLSKAELSASRLLTSVVVGLRSYRDIRSAREQKLSNNETVLSGYQFSGNKLSANKLPGSQFSDQQFQDSQVVADQLQQQMVPILKQSQRLQHFDLNPVAQDITVNLHAQHHRLHNSIGLLNNNDRPFKSEFIELVDLLNDVLNIFLPQSRLDGWLLGYRLDNRLPMQLKSDESRLEQLLTTAVELAILSSDGHDIKLILQPAEETGYLKLSVEQVSDLPGFTPTPWSQLLKQHLQRLCGELRGKLIENNESGTVHCLLPI